jgi:aminoglycoside phosphotransferase (APT) family kinase protein
MRGRSQSVVAKMRPRGGLDLEREIHQVVLPMLGVETPQFLGFAGGADGVSDVLFLEYVGASEFRPSEAAHQDAAGRWLGSLHAASARVTIPALVPRRSLDEERVAVADIRMRVSAMVESPLLDAPAQLLLWRVGEQLDAVLHRWPGWANQVAGLPQVLTHGAFVARNVRMCGSGDTLTTIPFDWDHAAVRSPAVDLARTPIPGRGFAANASLEHYRGALAAAGAALDPEVVGAVATIGSAIRAAACIRWSIRSIVPGYVDQPLADIGGYLQALDAALGKGT